MIPISKCSWESPKLLLGTNKLYIWRVCYTLHTTITLNPQFFKVYETHRWWSIRLEKFSNLPRLTTNVFHRLISKLCLTLATPWTVGSSVHGIYQARILEWVAISYSRGSSQSRNPKGISCFSSTDRQIIYHCTTCISHSLTGFQATSGLLLIEASSLGLYNLVLLLTGHWM